ncbi:MAG: phosphohistidine phosphatase SixA [Methylomonas sp.]
MLITFLRHATAEDKSPAIPDSERALTEKGEKQVKRVAAFCQANRLVPAKIYCSPLLRAKQTAKIFQALLPTCPAAETVDWLDTSSSPITIIAELGKLADQGLDNIWLVGHEPDFSETIGQLLGTGGANIAIKKAALARLDADFSDQPPATLQWSIPCSLM